VRNFYWISVGILIGCGPKAPDAEAFESDSGQADIHVSDCETVLITDPENNATDHYYRDPIRFFLSEPDPNAQVITDVQGVTSVEADGRTIVFTPSQPLAPSTDYRFTLDYCFAEPEITFSTSALGTPIGEGVDLENRVFSIDLTSGKYTVGEGVGDLINVLFTRRLLFSLETINVDSLDVLTAIAENTCADSVQDLCARTVNVDDIDIRESPFFTKDILNFSFGSHSGELRFARFAVSGTITQDGDSIGGLAFEATLSVDEISQSIPALGTPDEICTYTANLGVACAECPDGGWSPCIVVAAEHIEGTLVDLDLVEVEEAGLAEGCE
jgi:hypothetical protein